MRAWETAADAVTAVVASGHTAACCVAGIVAMVAADRPATCWRERNLDPGAALPEAYHFDPSLATYPVVAPSLEDDGAFGWVQECAVEPWAKGPCCSVAVKADGMTARPYLAEVSVASELTCHIGCRAC